MKIFTNAQIHELDSYTIEHEPVTNIDLMERASKAIAGEIEKRFAKNRRMVVFAGKGNNGGDALAVARMLAADGYKVSAFLFNIHNDLSTGCETNRNRIVSGSLNINFTEITTDFDPPTLNADDVVIDGIFGSGLNKPLTGGFASLVRYINASSATVVSIDVPSGLMTEDNSDNVAENIVRADLTLTLQTKKLSMLFADCQEFVGRVEVLDIGLSPHYIEKTPVQYCIVEEQEVKSLLLPRNDFVHKGNMGTAMIIAGSKGMAGAAVLAVKACLRAGAGKVIAHVPPCNSDIMQITVPEAVVRTGVGMNHFSDAIDIGSCNALGIGPGLGCEEDTAIALISQIRRTKCPIVADADALNMLASHRAWLQQLPEGIIFTPHPAELDRLSGATAGGDYNRLAYARGLAEQINGYVVLKGHFSALCMPDGRILFNSTGNAGMATAGSGDVLTGIITGLLARGYKRAEACLLGMYLHGLAGDIAAEENSVEGLIASDIIAALPKALKKLYDK